MGLFLDWLLRRETDISKYRKVWRKQTGLAATDRVWGTPMGAAEKAAAGDLLAFEPVCTCGGPVITRSSGMSGLVITMRLNDAPKFGVEGMAECMSCGRRNFYTAYSGTGHGEARGKVRIESSSGDRW